MFLLVAENASFRAAAMAANRSQSAVSNQIKQLEDQLGVALFHRTTRSVSLTAEGQVLVSSVQTALQEVDAGLRSIEESVDLRRGHVSLACSPTIAGSQLPYVLKAFSEDYPNITLFVRELISEDIHFNVRSRSVDFGIGPNSDEPDLDCEVIAAERLCALVPRGLHAAEGKTIPFRELAKLPLLLLSPATALRNLVEETAADAGLMLSTNYQFTQTQTLIASATAGLGAAILPRIAVPSVLPERVQMLHITDPVMTRELALITLRGHVLGPAAARLSRLVHKMLRDTIINAPYDD